MKSAEVSAGRIQDVAVAARTGMNDDVSSIIVTASRLESDSLKLTAWKLDVPARRFATVACTELRGLETTDDQGSSHDEPYAIFVTIDIDHPTESTVQRTKIFSDVDEDSAKRSFEIQLGSD